MAIWLSNTAKAKVHRLEVHGNSVRGYLSTFQESKKGSGKWLTSFWNASFFGNAFEAATKLQDKQKIIIKQGKITNEVVNDKNGNPVLDENGREKRSVRISITDFEVVEDTNQTRTYSQDIQPMDEVESEEDLPF